MRVGLLAVVAAMVFLADGCIPVDPTRYESVGGYTEASCFCAICAEAPFCLSGLDPDGNPITTPLAMGESCPAGAMQSTEASRVRPEGTLAAGFFCVAPDGKNPFFNAVACPDIFDEHSEENRAPYENVEPCIDLPPECTPDACPGDEDPSLCSTLAYLGPRRATCIHQDTVDPHTVEQAQLEATRQTVGQCETAASPPIEPARYCFASCVWATQIARAVEGSCTGPVPPMSGAGVVPLVEASTPRQTTHSALYIVVAPTSTATIHVRTDLGTFSGDVGVAGVLAIHAPGCRMAEESCSDAGITSVGLRATGDLNIATETVRDIEALNLHALPGSLVGVSAHESMLTIESGTMIARGERGGTLQSGSMDLSGPVMAMIDWTTRTFTFDATFDGTDTSLDIHLDGALPNLPPSADAGADQTVECGEGPVELSASGSSDPDGASDIVAYSWSRASPAGVVPVALTRDASVELALGAHSLAVAVTDRRGYVDVDGVHVDVEDTRPPTIDAELVTDCVWSPGHTLALFRLGEELRATSSDLCGASTGVRIVDVYSSEPADGGGDGATPVDVRFGSGAFCIRAERSGRGRGRVYTVVLEAVDDAGNVTRGDVHLRVPHDQRPPHRCDTGGLVQRVADDDPRCTASVPLVVAGGAGASASSPHPGPPAVPPAGAPGDGCAVSGPGSSSRAWVLMLVIWGCVAWRRQRRP